MCCSLFTIVQYNRYSSWKQLQWIYKQGAGHIQDICSAFWQPLKYSQKRTYTYRGKMYLGYQGPSWLTKEVKMYSVIRLYCRMMVNVTVWTYLCGCGRWPGRKQCFCDKHLTRLQCIRREFHSLKNTIKHPILPFPPTIIIFLLKLLQQLIPAGLRLGLTPELGQNDPASTL